MSPLSVSETAVFTYGACIGPISKELMSDAARLRSFINNTPWERPNRNPMPRFVPFPTVDKVEQRYKRARRRVQEMRERIDCAVDILRSGVPEYDPW